MGGHISADHGRTTTSRHGGSCRRARLSSRQCRPRRASFPALLFVAMAGAVQAGVILSREGHPRCRRARNSKKDAVELRRAAEADDQGGRRWKHRLGAGGISNSHSLVPSRPLDH